MGKHVYLPTPAACGGGGVEAVKRLTTVDFIARAQAKHGVGTYDYSQAVYVNNKSKVTIICPAHGPFKQTPSSHFKAGCIECSGNARKNTDIFIEQARQVHGSKYDYSLVVYASNKTKITIVCPSHGPFEQQAKSHLFGCGCMQCSGNARKNTDIFIEQARQVHGSKYDYSLVKYVSARTKVTIICPAHGSFEQISGSHLLYGCQRCVQDGRILSQLRFIERARQVHGSKYDYSLAKYVTSKSKVTIICPTHGPFQQKPNSHLSNRGCYTCGQEAAKSAARLDWIERANGRTSTLYFLRIFSSNEYFYKVGVTFFSVVERYREGRALNGYQYEVLAQHTSSNAAAVYDWEQSILETFSHLAYAPRKRFGGDTECFSSADEILAVFPL